MAGQGALPVRTIAELTYVVTSAVVAYAATRLAIWGYPQGGDTIRIVGLVSTGIVILMGVKPLATAWIADHGAQNHG